jgi:hypothetical protein
MSTTLVIFVIAIAIVTAIALRRGGPRVTQIDRTVRRKKEDQE